jgi:hypothetical protein
MDPILIIVVPGVAGGLLIAALLFALHRRGPGPIAAPDRDGPPPADVINAARIRVAGVGGLGLLAMAAAVAWKLPRIAQTLEIGAALGIVLAVALILRRRASGAMPSAGQRPGANTTLSIDQPDIPDHGTKIEDRETGSSRRPRAELLGAGDG